MLQSEDKVRELAYLKAEQDGFRGCPVSYWIAAEQEVYTQPKVSKLLKDKPKIAAKVAPKITKVTKKK